MFAYSATKGAINGMLMPMARDLGKFGIRVLAVAPGLFNTPMPSLGTNYKDQEKKQKYMYMATPMGRPGQPDEFAHAATVCIENSYLNGVVIGVDGAQVSPNL